MANKPVVMTKFISCDPPTSTSAGAMGGVALVNGRPVRFKPKSAKEAEAIWVSLLKDHAPACPFEGALMVEVELTWTWRAAEPKKNRALGWIPKCTKPDFDNLAKTLMDAMQTTGYFLNDSQVADGRISKRFGSKPGIKITIARMM